MSATSLQLLCARFLGSATGKLHDCEQFGKMGFHPRVLPAAKFAELGREELLKDGREFLQ